MSDDQDHGEALLDAVRIAARRREPMRIVGSDSKRFLGRRTPYARELFTSDHRGVVTYQPDELVLTARAGTPLAQVEQTLAAQRQHLPFEPPHFGAAGGTFGGAIASGLSGPARPFLGPARDFVLGVRMINGRGQSLRFGGEVMKNVAGYDLSRLLTGSFGTLGVLLDVSVKVLPAPALTRTLTAPADQRTALEHFRAVRREALPVSAAAWYAGNLFIRIGGSELAIAHAVERLRTLLPQLVEDTDPDRWAALRDLRLPVFERPPQHGLYRLSVAPAARPVDLPGTCVLDWAGAQRWLVSSAPIAQVRNEARALGGHATCYYPPHPQEDDTDAGDDALFHPLPPTVYAIHRRLKAAFDPHGVLNPGRLYPGI